MPATSEARIRASQMNGRLSKGPTSAAGRRKSSKNSLIHGLSGSGVVLADADAAEVEARAADLMAEYAPQTTVGKALIGKLAIFSVRAERAAGQEMAAVASRVRNASRVFDQDRVDLAEDLFDALADDPRRNLRKLMRTPEGVDRLLDAWRELTGVLTRSDRPRWTSEDRQMVSHLLGLRPEREIGTALDSLSAVLLGESAEFNDPEWAEMDDDRRRVWVRDALVERIVEEVESLEEHRETLDFEVIELDRLGAPKRASFDDSRPACLARRYESEANRLFFKTLAELRRVEAEALERPKPQAARQPELPPVSSRNLESALPPKQARTPEPNSVSDTLGSFWEETSASRFEPLPVSADLFEGFFNPPDGAARGLDGRVISIGRATVATR